MKEFLSQRGVAFREQDVSRDRGAAETLFQRTGQMAVPVIEVDGELIVGFNRARLEQILTKQERVSLGVAVTDARKMAATLGTGIAVGAYIGRVRPDSPAALMGLAKGDIILEINSQRIASADDLERVVSSLSRGSQVSVLFVRAGRESRAQGTL